MRNCHDDVLAFHNDAVTLPNKERTEMRDRRDANRRRLKSGLKRDGEPSVRECCSQGSYAMRTMVQQPDNDYDIDDGVYFDKDKLEGPRGGDKTAGEAREMVRKALHEDNFKRPPETLKNCVRVYYDAGYHVDVPVYRQVTETNFWGEEETSYELASSDWKRSDPRSVTKWFQDANRDQSPDSDNGGQLRRMVRLLKAFARSRTSWREQIASGFMITKLVVEKYTANPSREDKALYDTMVAIRDRLLWSLEIGHPTIAGEMLTKGPDDGRANCLRAKLEWAIAELEILSDSNVTREQALKAWDKVFNTKFFIGRIDDDKVDASKNRAIRSAAALGVAAAVLTKDSEASDAVDKHGGGRYA